jgi:hypothetical protein
MASSAERRAARKRKQQVRDRRRSTQRPDPSADELIGGLVAAGAALAWGPEADPDRVSEIAERLVLLDPALTGLRYADTLLTNLLGELWEDGWQPADVDHVVRRWSTPRLGRLAVLAIAAQAAATSAATRAPAEWLEQLSVLGARHDAPARPVAHWLTTEGLDPAATWREALTLAGLLGSLGPLQQLDPPPSRWTARTARRSVAGTDARLLDRIRALLAKAEGTDFPDEAEALSDKAQELMTRHAIDVALLETSAATTPVEVVARRVHVDNPYAEPKVRLLDAVGSANGVRVVWLEDLGMVTIVGPPSDLAAVDLLFTSLLVQATRAMEATGRAGGARSRAPGFRRGFLTAYAVRIGERLTETRDRVTDEARGTDLVPVLRARQQAVDDAFAAMFPDSYARESRSFDARGWYAGRAAADDAHLGPTGGGQPISGG